MTNIGTIILGGAIIVLLGAAAYDLWQGWRTK